MLYLRARWYAVETGTFLSRDPVESELPYQYVRGNPTRFVDPTGYLRNDTIARLFDLEFNEVIERAERNSSFGLLKALQDIRIGDTLKVSFGFLRIIPPGQGFASLVPTYGGIEWRVLCDGGKVSPLPAELFDMPGSNPWGPGGLREGPAYAINNQGPSSTIPGYLNKPRRETLDYLLLSFGFPLPWIPFLSANVNPIIDRYGNVYGAGEVGRGFGFNSPDFGGNAGGGMYVIPGSRWDLGIIPSEETLVNHLSGLGLNLEVSHPFVPILGFSESISLQGWFPWEWGLSFNGTAGTHSTFSAFVGHSWKLLNYPESAWDWMDRTPGFGRSDIQMEDVPGNKCSNECSQPGNVRYIPLTSSKE